MVAEPEAPPVTTPLVPTVATLVLLLLQVPPLVPSLSVIAWNWHTSAGPAIAAGEGFTNIVIESTTLPQEPIAWLK